MGPNWEIQGWRVYWVQIIALHHGGRRRGAINSRRECKLGIIYRIRPGSPGDLERCDLILLLFNHSTVRGTETTILTATIIASGEGIVCYCLILNTMITSKRRDVLG